MAMTTPNLWQKLLGDSSVRAKLPHATLLLVGDHDSGKTALLSRLDEQPNDDTNAVMNTGNATTNDALNEALRVANGGSTTLAFRPVHVLDPRAKTAMSVVETMTMTEGGAADDDVIACLDTYTLNEVALTALLPLALKAARLGTTIAAITVDLSRPWTIKPALEQVRGDMQ